MARSKAFSKVTKVEEESRRETMQRGIKHGTIQNTIDKTLDKFGDPVAGKAVELFKKLHPSADIAAPAVDTFVKSSILAGFAEIVQAANLVGGKIPGVKKIDEDKYKQLAGYLRGYAGQRAGTQTADGMFQLAPVVMEMLSNPALKELLGDDKATAPAVAQLPAADKTGHVDLAAAVKHLKDDDE